MASTVRMLMAGLALVGNTFALIVFALGGGAAFTQLQSWYSSWHYAASPTINPSIIQWAFPVFYGTLLLLEVILIAATYFAIVSKKSYYTDTGY